LTHGARSVLMHSKQPGVWVDALCKRRPSNIVVIALANKMARMIWAILAHERAYQGDWISIKPA
jgi:transposase